MIVWCRIHGTPIRQFYTDVTALPLLDQKQARHATLTNAGSLKTTTGSENANVTFTFKNSSNQMKNVFANPPLNALVEIFGDDELLFEGTFTQISLASDTCQIQIQA